MRNLLFWAWLLVLLPQAVKLRRAAPTFVAPPGPRSGAIPGKPSVVLIGIGDSLIEGVGAGSPGRSLVAQAAACVSRSFGTGAHWTCIGSIGATCGKVSLRLLPRLPETAADFFVVSVGVNDILSLTSLRNWRRSLDALLRSLHAHSPGAVIGLVGIPPLDEFPRLPAPLRRLFGYRGRCFDRIAQRVAAAHPYARHVPADFSGRVVTFADDGFHPSEQSHALLGAAVAAVLLQPSP
jgi:lysophospholipase L1-like esterase